MFKVSGLNIFPVKSLHGVSLEIAELKTSGLKYDRSWMITDFKYNFITQRKMPLMSSVKTSIKDNLLILEHKSISPLYIDIGRKSVDLVKTSIWKDNCFAYDEGNEASKWLTEILGKVEQKDLRLLKFAEEHKRQVDEKYLRGEKAHTEFSDSFPFLITSEKSLDVLNEKLINSGSHPVGMDRFRANIILKGNNAFEEDKLNSLSEINNKYILGIRKPCKRCVIITIDQESGEIIERKEPLKTLSEMNQYSNLRGAFFGQNATLIAGENQVIKIGDKLKGIYN